MPTIAVIHDHIALPALGGLNPLVGPNDESVGPRFPPMSNGKYPQVVILLSTSLSDMCYVSGYAAYDIELQRIAFRAGHELGFKEDLMQSGTYAWVSGPTYESRAECKFLQYCGADMVGMSTAPEVIVARHAVSTTMNTDCPRWRRYFLERACIDCSDTQGMRVLGLSLITNKVISTPYRDVKSEVAAEISQGQLAKKAPLSAEEKEETTSHEEVLEVGRLAAKDMSSLVAKIVELAGPSLL